MKFLKKVIEGQGVEPSSICLEAFKQNFQHSVNVEWYDKGDYFEAIFYKEHIEHIALFSKDGDLIEYKLYLPDECLPERIMNIMESKGEIMNSVLKNKGNTIEYEVIYRDKDLNRYVILLSDLGHIIDEKKL